MIESTLLQTIVQTAKAAVVMEWRRQGHELTGNAARSIEERITTQAGATNIEFWIEGYMSNINAGVPANRIPYSPGSGAPHSKYIEGLTRYARLRFGATQKEALSIAFAIARKHLREGLPSVGSKRFSKTGKRTGFIETALESEEDRLGKLIEQAIEQTYTLLIESFFKSQIQGR